MARTLIVYLHGIGDNIMLSGVLREYCRRQPGTSIDLVVLNAACAAFWQHHPLVNQVTVYPASQPHFWNPVQFYLLDQWKVRRYIAELNHDRRYERVFFPSIQTLPEILYHVTGTYGRHKIDRICADLGVPKELYPYDFHTAPEEAAAAAGLLKSFSGKRLAVLHPFSGHAKKRISAAGFGEIIRTLKAHDFSPLVVGAPNEKSQLDPAWEIEAHFGLPFGVLIEVLKRAELFAGTDSSVAHLAAGANTPQLVIFSPKLEPRRYLPLSARSKISLIRIGQNQEQKSLAEFTTALAAG